MLAAIEESTCDKTGLGQLRTALVQHRYTAVGKKGRCIACYKRNKDEYGRIYAIKRTKQVSSRCEVCSEKPLCLDCFFLRHIITAKY